DDDRSDRRHADAPPQRGHRQPGQRAHAVLEAQGGPGGHPPPRGLHRRLQGERGRHPPGSHPGDHHEVHPRPLAHDLRPPPGVQAGPAGLHPGRQPAARARRPRRRRALDQPGAAHRPGGASAPGRWRSPLLRVV
ncbi:MAG: SSU ribosomal protein S8p (S15Ae), partial [uncultured Acidimicrobiales bacterium]